MINSKNRSRNIAWHESGSGITRGFTFLPFASTCCSFHDIIVIGMIHLYTKYSTVTGNQVIGGTSILVDALHVAHKLRESHSVFHYIVDGHCLHRDSWTSYWACSPIHIHNTIVIQILISIILFAPPMNTPIDFYPSITHFSKMLDDPMNTYKYTLREGDTVIIDDRRVLHAPMTFKDKPGWRWSRARLIGGWKDAISRPVL